MLNFISNFMTNTKSNDKTESNLITIVQPVINVEIRITERLLITILTILFGSGLALGYRQLGGRNPEKLSPNANSLNSSYTLVVQKSA